MAYQGYRLDRAAKIGRLMDALSRETSRELVHYFESVSQTDTESIDAVASQLDSRMQSRSLAELKLALHHCHLPKLEEAGWVEYDTRSGDIHYYGDEDAPQLLLELSRVFSDS